MIDKIINTVIQGDCLDVMKSMPDKCVDLVLTDPPYGIGGGLRGGRPFSMLGGEKWDNAPDDNYFNELKRISKNQIIWGGNYFNLGRTRGFIIWHKENDGRDFSECEYAWTSFEKPSRIYKQRFIGKKDTQHPTEKPVALFQWILNNYSHPGMTIFDPFAGSGTTAIVCLETGRNYILVEKEPEYIEIINKRIETWKEQGRMFL
jgi:site-specific DNA-methyltransferase (adenine-specific)